MDLASFPSLPSVSSSVAGGAPVTNWKALLLSQPHISSDFKLSFQPSAEDKIVLSDEEVDEASKKWSLSLVGYVLGKRPYYGNLLTIVKNLWKLKGSVDLVSLADGFFLFNFNCLEDLNLVLLGGPWFIHGKPIILKKWSYDFKPIKEDFKDVPIWIRLPNLPLCCWSEVGISKIVSKIGIPLTVDPLTAKGSRLTYARVSVQVNISSPLPDSITISIKGEDVVQPVIYEWKPNPCLMCSTFAHESTSCPKSPSYKPPAPPLNRRGRSRSRPLGRPSASISRPPPASTLPPLLPVPSSVSSLPPVEGTDLNLPAPATSLPSSPKSDIGLTVDHSSVLVSSPSVIANAPSSAPAPKLVVPSSHSPPKYPFWGVHTRNAFQLLNEVSNVSTIGDFQEAQGLEGSVSNLVHSKAKKGKGKGSSSNSSSQ